jgi:hypothetical protein
VPPLTRRRRAFYGLLDLPDYDVGALVEKSGKSASHRRPLVDPYHLREMPLTVLVDREGRLAISHAGVVDPLVFEADINALLAE